MSDIENANIMINVSAELRAQLNAWSAPVQVKVIETPGIGTGWEMIFRRPEGQAVVPATVDREHEECLDVLAGYRPPIDHDSGSFGWDGKHVCGKNCVPQHSGHYVVCADGGRLCTNPICPCKQSGHYVAACCPESCRSCPRDGSTCTHPETHGHMARERSHPSAY